MALTPAEKLEQAQTYSLTNGALIQVREFANIQDRSDKLYIVYNRGNKLFIFTKETPWLYYSRVEIRSSDYVTESTDRGYRDLTSISHHSSLEWVYTEYGIKVWSLTEGEKRILNDAEVMLSL